MERMTAGQNTGRKEGPRQVAMTGRPTMTRAWNAEHGGVYVPVSEKVQPNPYLEDPLRDIVTDKGVKLTKINPAYMTRQIARINSSQNNIKFHITSLKPIRPQNKPTSWEEKWLQSFEQGEVEQGEFVAVGGDSFWNPDGHCRTFHVHPGVRDGTFSIG